MEACLDQHQSVVFVLRTLLRVYVMNATSLTKQSALYQLATNLNQFDIGAATVTELFLLFTNNHDDQFTNIPGYCLLRKDRDRKKGGGVAIYVRYDVDCSLISSVTTDQIPFIEVIWVKCCCL
jgi:hypothetical protein